jgi:hypothetical protein
MYTSTPSSPKTTAAYNHGGPVATMKYLSSSAFGKVDLNRNHSTSRSPQHASATSQKASASNRTKILANANEFIVLGIGIGPRWVIARPACSLNCPLSLATAH